MKIITATIHTTFDLKERLRVLFGFHHHSAVEIEVKVEDGEAKVVSNAGREWWTHPWRRGKTLGLSTESKA